MPSELPSGYSGIRKEAIYKDLNNSNEDILTIKELNGIKNSNLVKKK